MGKVEKTAEKSGFVQARYRFPTIKSAVRAFHKRAGDASPAATDL